MTRKEEYKKELKRIKRFIRSAEKRGYRFEKSPIPKQPKNIRKESVERLKKLTATELYKKATAISEETGKIISGSEKLKETRRLAGKRTQRFLKEAREIGLKTVKELKEYKKFEKARIAQDIIDRKKAENIKEGNMIMSQLNDLADSYGGQGSYLFKQFIGNVISTYGLDSVLTSISTASQDFLASGQTVIYYTDRAAVKRSIVKMGFIISGNKMNDVLQKQLGEILDELDEMYEEYET